MSTQQQAKNLIQIRKSLQRGKAGNLAENKAFLDFLVIQKELSAQIDATWDVIKDRMEEYNITKIDGEWGYIKMATRTTYSGSSTRRYMKKVLDTEKVRAHVKLAGKLPEGVRASTTTYLAKKIKVA